MKLDWWEPSFSQTYKIFTQVLLRILAGVILIRLILGVSSYPDLISYCQIQGIMAISLLALMSRKINKYSTTIKQFYLFTMIEAINFSLKYNSLAIFHEETMLTIIQSTLLTILFQMRIFESIFANAFIMIKHLILWYFWADLNDQYIIPKPTTIVISMIIFIIWITFEINHRTHLKENFLAKETIKKSNMQITEFLRLFNDGLLIMSKAFTLQYANDKIEAILKPENQDYTSKLKAILIKDTECSIYDKLKKIPWKYHCETISIGVSIMDNSWYEWTVKISNWEDQLCYMITVKDVTDILYVERIASENRSKRALIRSISHELRTPINAISLIVDELRNTINLEFQSQLSMIRSCVWLLNCQVSDILDYSELVSGKFILNPSKYNFKDSLLICVRFFSVQAAYKGIELVAKIDPDIPEYCFADEFRVQKVVTNLLSNAIKYTNKGSVNLCVIHTGSAIEISVTDSGIGIHESRLAFIFEMFSDNSGGLTSELSGLGLHVSNIILRLAGTSMKVTSKIGEGSVFSFCLDALMDKPRIKLGKEIEIPWELTRRTHLPESLVLQKLNAKILIVDDNDFNRLTLGNILKLLCVRYIEAVNGEIAVQIVSQYDKSKYPIRCVIMDCDMPVMDGWEATRRIISRYNQGLLKHLPTIIGHTAYSSKEDIQRCYESGMTSHFLKPTTREEVLSVITSYI